MRWTEKEEAYKDIKPDKDVRLVGYLLEVLALRTASGLLSDWHGPVLQKLNKKIVKDKR